MDTRLKTLTVMNKGLLAAVLGACTTFSALLPAGTHAQTAAKPAPGQKLESVTYLLPAPQNLPAFGPWMIAQQQGYFAEEGLEVNFVTGKGGADVAKQVGAGNAPIGGATGDTAIIVRNNNVPVKAVAVLGAGSHLMLASHQSAPVTQPAQIKGKTISVVGYADTGYYSLLGTMRLAGLTRNDAQIQAAGPAGVWQLFAKGDFQLMMGVPDWIVAAQDAGANVTWMPPENGAQSMAQAIIASDDIIAKNPELVGRLVRATLRGMKLIMTDMDAAVAAYVQAVPMHVGKENQVRRIFELYNRYAYANQAVPGQIDVQRLAALQDFYVQEGIVSKAAPLEDLYTNQFVQTKP